MPSAAAEPADVKEGVVLCEELPPELSHQSVAIQQGRKTSNTKGHQAL